MQASLKPHGTRAAAPTGGREQQVITKHILTSSMNNGKYVRLPKFLIKQNNYETSSSVKKY